MTKMFIIIRQGIFCFSGGYPRKSADTAEDAGDPALLTSEEITVVTSVDGCMDYSPLEKIENSFSISTMTASLDIDKLKAALVSMGYERVGQVEMPDSFQ